MAFNNEYTEEGLTELLQACNQTLFIHGLDIAFAAQHGAPTFESKSRQAFTFGFGESVYCQHQQIAQFSIEPCGMLSPGSYEEESTTITVDEEEEEILDLPFTFAFGGANNDELSYFLDGDHPSSQSTNGLYLSVRGTEERLPEASVDFSEWINLKDF